MRGLTFSACACLPLMGQFALARAKAKKVAAKRGDDPDSVPDIREGGLEV